MSAKARQTPALIVWGERDHPENGAPQSEAFTTSQKAVIRGAGHACYLDSPDVFHEAVLSWLDVQDLLRAKGR